MPPTPRSNNADPWGWEAAGSDAHDEVLVSDDYVVVEIEADEAGAELLALIAGRPRPEANNRTSP